MIAASQHLHTNYHTTTAQIKWEKPICIQFCSFRITFWLSKSSLYSRCYSRTIIEKLLYCISMLNTMQTCRESKQQKLHAPFYDKCTLLCFIISLVNSEWIHILLFLTKAVISACLSLGFIVNKLQIIMNVKLWANY